MQTGDERLLELPHQGLAMHSTLLAGVVSLGGAMHEQQVQKVACILAKCPIMLSAFCSLDSYVAHAPL